MLRGFSMAITPSLLTPINATWDLTLPIGDNRIRPIEVGSGSSTWRRAFLESGCLALCSALTQREQLVGVGVVSKEKEKRSNGHPSFSWQISAGSPGIEPVQSL